MSDHSTPATHDVVPPALRQAYEQNHLVPLWESKTAETFGKAQEEAQLWRWSTMLPIVEETGKLKAEHVLDRRVLLKTKPNRHHIYDEAVTGQLYCDFQLVQPGERARPHRHPMNALRFVVQASGGARSVVNGKDCTMSPGDLILTPGWCWHEHINEGKDPVIWLDVLDVGLHYVLGTTGFQQGPVRDVPPQLPDAIFTNAGLVPRLDETDHASRGYSPIFHYAWADAVRALEAAPMAADGSREIRYTNPLTGGPAMDLLDSTLLQLAAGQPTRRYKSSASTVCFVVEGQGASQIGDKTLEWDKHDLFTMPANLFASHEAKNGARIFQVSNREVYRRLGLFSEAWGD
jgi:gentisate 1,2-dioxygenase